ncbi:MAG TPA: phage major capsid protein, partial [Azonexus sp.]|nr:phage major capsid protein [Azonexus sp.]
MKTIAIAGLMAAHFAAFQARAADTAGCYEKRDDPTIKSVADAIDKIANAFEEYKKTNDQRLDAIKKGQSTTDLDAKLARIDTHMDSLNEMKASLEKMETKLSRPGAIVGELKGQEETEDREYREAFIDWMRAPGDHERQARASAAAKAVETKNAKSRENRATQTVAGTNSAGGYALPKTIEQAIARLSVDISDIRSIATVRQVGTTDYHEIFDINGAGFEWLGEGDTRN